MLAKSLLSLAIVAPAGMIALAADPPPQKVAAPPAQRPAAAELNQRQVQALMRRYEQVGLTAEQKEQIRPLVKGQIDELRALRMEREITEDERQLRARAILDEYRGKIESTLTPEQKTRLQELRETNRKAMRNAATQKPRPPVPEEE
jgi:hypothetical protein